MACSFWFVDNYILQGRFEEARRLFDRLLSRCNDVGLLAEEFCNPDICSLSLSGFARWFIVSSRFAPKYRGYSAR